VSRSRPSRDGPLRHGRSRLGAPPSNPATAHRRRRRWLAPSDDRRCGCWTEFCEPPGLTAALRDIGARGVERLRAVTVPSRPALGQSGWPGRAGCGPSRSGRRTHWRSRRRLVEAVVAAEVGRDGEPVAGAGLDAREGPAAESAMQAGQEPVPSATPSVTRGLVSPGWTP
jgi:hypothetical protein